MMNLPNKLIVDYKSAASIRWRRASCCSTMAITMSVRIVATKRFIITVSRIWLTVRLLRSIIW